MLCDQIWYVILDFVGPTNRSARLTCRNFLKYMNNCREIVIDGGNAKKVMGMLKCVSLANIRKIRFVNVSLFCGLSFNWLRSKFMNVCDVEIIECSCDVLLYVFRMLGEYVMRLKFVNCNFGSLYTGGRGVLKMEGLRKLGVQRISFEQCCFGSKMDSNIVLQIAGPNILWDDEKINVFCDVDLDLGVVYDDSFKICGGGGLCVKNIYVDVRFMGLNLSIDYGHLGRIDEVYGIRGVSLNRCCNFDLLSNVMISGLVKLEITECDSSSKSFELLSGLPSKNLRELKLVCCKYLNDLSFIRHFDLLEVLHVISCNRLREEDFVLSLSDRVNLIELDLSNCIGGCKNFNFVNNLKKLRRLNISGRGYVYNIAWSNLVNLEELSMAGRSINARVDIDGGFKNLKLTKLIMKKCVMKINFFDNIIDVATIEYLDLSECWEITDDAICKISEKMTNLKHLNLCGYEIGQIVLGRLGKLRNLEYLNVRHCEINNDTYKIYDKLDKLRVLICKRYNCEISLLKYVDVRSS